MKIHWSWPACLAVPAAIVLFAYAPAARAQAGGAAPGELSKPLADFTIGDIFPRVVGDPFRQTGIAWQEASRELLAQAKARSESVSLTSREKKRELATIRTDLKEARRSKDFVKEGTLTGTRENETIVLDLLERIERLSLEQRQLADAWDRAGRAMQKFVDADERFDQHRSAGISRPEDPNAIDTRLDLSGYQAFSSHAKAMEELGDSFRALAAEVNDLAVQRMKFLDELERGGRIQPRRR